MSAAIDKSAALGGERLGRDDVDVLVRELSNWGRWGDDDQLGTLNLITPATRMAALGSVRSGTTVSCARSMDLRRDSSAPAPMHFMTSTGDRAPASGFGSAADWVGLTAHGFDTTHIDAHSHAFWNAQLYNGRPAKLVTTWGRAKTGAVDAARDGIVTRGVLLDIPRHRGVDRLEPASAIGPDELQECARRQQVELQEGDALLVRTNREEHPSTDGGLRLAGVHVSVMPWLHERGISVLVSDAISDVQPSGVEGVSLPVHAVALVGMGLWLIDNATFEDLAVACAERGAYDFLFTCHALPIQRATGCPVNPVAVL